MVCLEQIKRCCTCFSEEENEASVTPSSCAGSLLLPGREQACLYVLLIHMQWESVPDGLVQSCLLCTASQKEGKWELCFCVAVPAERAAFSLLRAVS